MLARIRVTVPVVAVCLQVRRGLSAEKKKKLGVTLEAVEEEDEGEWLMETHAKTKAEIARIKLALKGNFLFQHLPETQSKQIYDCMRRTEVTAGEVVIQQGDKGESFYVLDDGEYKVAAMHPAAMIARCSWSPIVSDRRIDERVSGDHRE